MIIPLRAMRVLWPVAAVFAPASPAFAQSGCNLNQVAQMPVAIVGGRPAVQVVVDGRPLTFIVDSSSGYSIIDPAVAKALNLSVGPTRLFVNGVAGGATPGQTEVNDFRVAGVRTGKRLLLVMPTGGAPGILGREFLGAPGVEYDLPHGVIRMFNPKGCRGVDLAYWAIGKPFTTLAMDSPVTGFVGRASAILNGGHIKVTLDTGAQASVLTTRAAASAGVKPGKDGVKAVDPISGAGPRQVQVWRGPFASFKLGDEEMKNVELQFGDINLKGSDMLLGADFFLSHRVFVSMEQNKAYITYEGGALFGRPVEATVTPGTEGPAEAASTAAGR